MPVALIKARCLLDDFADTSVALEAYLALTDGWKLHGSGDVGADQTEELADTVFAAFDSVR